MSTGDSNWPGDFDDEYGTEQNYQDGFWDNFDTNGTGFWTWARKAEHARTQMQTYSPRVIGKVAGVSYDTSSSAHTVLASTITVPANLLRAGSILEVRSRGIVTLNSGSPTLTFTALLGGVSYSLGTTGAQTADANAHQYSIIFSFTANTIGATADVHSDGRWNLSAATTSPFAVNASTLVGGGTGTVDTTSAMTFDLKATMSVANAANSLVSGLTTITHIPYIG